VKSIAASCALEGFLGYQTYAVLGAGLSGRAATGLLRSLGKEVFLFDDNAEPGAEPLTKLSADGVQLFLGADLATPESLAPAEALVVSPGVAQDHPIAHEARRRGLPVRAELELGWLRRGGARVAAVTGTNGKTTVTMLIQKLCADAGRRSVAAGNIGLPLSEAVRTDPEDLARTVFAVEVSSFQLETIDAFRPDWAVVLNVTPDHLDRHPTMEQYARAKQRLTARQGPDDVLVVNQDDARCLAIGARGRARVRRFSLERPVEDGAWLDGDLMMLKQPGERPRRLMALDGLKLIGLHNVANAMAAACVAQAIGIDRKRIAATLAAFHAAPHRLEPVGERGGVAFINDSKATNLGAMARAVECFTGGIHLIAGGRDKNSPFATITAELHRRVRAVYLIGEATAAMQAAWGGEVECLRCETLGRALAEAAARAAEGETVLLSPGCASFDQFHSYADRGRRFAEAVQALIRPANPE